MSKIIIVEDDPMIAEIYSKKFQVAGFDVTVASSGKEVLKVAREGEFDLILLDMIMSEMGGLEVLEELKKSGKYSPKMKVVMFSNLADVEEQNKAFAKGADGYLLKSHYSPSDLVREVERILGEYAEQAHNKERENESAENIANGKTEKSGKKRILFIEDEDIFIELFGKKLMDDGFEVEFAKNGAWGMKEAMDKDFDLIIMDVVMPSMTGREILERLQLEERTKKIPVLVLSASAADEDLKIMEGMGIVASFVKTHVVPSDLSKKVHEIFNK
ncbi:response regulator [Patescibacteria group bacterium]|nr:MAG: response regulator [Patescibacteria group bacterium]